VSIYSQYDKSGYIDTWYTKSWILKKATVIIVHVLASWRGRLRSGEEWRAEQRRGEERRGEERRGARSHW
jgi:hypothetical protein